MPSSSTITIVPIEQQKEWFLSHQRELSRFAGFLKRGQGPKVWVQACHLDHNGHLTFLLGSDQHPFPPTGLHLFPDEENTYKLHAYPGPPAFIGADSEFVDWVSQKPRLRTQPLECQLESGSPLQVYLVPYINGLLGYCDDPEGLSEFERWRASTLFGAFGMSGLRITLTPVQGENK